MRLYAVFGNGVDLAARARGGTLSTMIPEASLLQLGLGEGSRMTSARQKLIFRILGMVGFMLALLALAYVLGWLPVER